MHVYQLFAVLNESFKLKEVELAHLYSAIAMRLVISVTKSAINKKEEPDNTYLLISEKSAWNLLKKWRAVSADFAHYSFREACNFSAHPDEEKFKSWAYKQDLKLTDLIPSAPSNKIFHLDLGVGSSWAGHQQELDDLELFDFKINRLQKQHPEKIIAGGYCEPVLFIALLPTIN